MTGVICHDLGKLDGPVMIFGGPYSNIQATRALIGEARRRGIGARNMICTGDVVAYCADGAATIAAIRESGASVVAGNCERQLAARAMDCGCGFKTGTTCDRLSAGWFAHANATIGGAARAWMASLPDLLTFEHQGRRCAVLHGGLTDIARFLWPVSEDAEFLEEIGAATDAAGPLDVIFSGHSGIAFTRDIGDVTWVNAGVIGMPPHDGRPATRYCLANNGRFLFHRLAYDHGGAARSMAQAGLAQGYEKSLGTGIWPSEDVLPAELRR